MWRSVTSFDANPGVRKVSFGGIPFFAISHDPGLSPREEYVVSSAGFWMQQLGSELILSKEPTLRERDSPLLKGMLAFNVLLSAGTARRPSRPPAPPNGTRARWPRRSGSTKRGSA